MSNENTLAESISSFSNQVSPVEPEQIIVVSLAQLSSLVTQAVEKALQPLQDEVMELRATVARQGEMIAALESTQEENVNRICLDIAYDRQRLARLEKVEPQPLQRDRGEILRALIAANGGKMLAKDARQKMRMDKGNFSRLLDTLKDDIKVKPLHTDKRKSLLIIK